MGEVIRICDTPPCNSAAASLTLAAHTPTAPSFNLHARNKRALVRFCVRPKAFTVTGEGVRPFWQYWPPVQAYLTI